MIAAEVLPEVEVLFGAAVPLEEKDFLGPADAPFGAKLFFGPADVPLGEKDFFGPAEEDFFGENERLPVADEGLFGEDGFLVLEAALPLFSDLAIILPVYSTKIGRLNYFSYFYGSKS